MFKNKYRKYFVLQHDEKDCGCACLKMIVRYYGGEVNLEYLKEISGTTSRGTSLLGLKHAAEKIGISTEAYKATLADLKEINNPCILHVVTETDYYHYVSFWGCRNNKFLIADPAIGIRKYDEKELNNIWESGYLLLTQKNIHFQESRKKSYVGYKWLIKNIEKDTSFYITAIFLGIIIALLSMATVIFTEKLVDVLLPSRNLIIIYKGIAVWIFMLFSIEFLSYLRSHVLIKQSLRFNIRTIKYFYRRLLNMPKPFFDSKRQGDMIARMNDTEQLQDNIRTIIADSFIEFIMLIFSLVFLVFYSPNVAMIGLLSIPVLLLSMYLFNPKVKNLQHKMFINYAQTEANYIDSISGIETIKIFNKEDNFSSKNISIYSKYQSYLAKLIKCEINQSTLISFCSTFIIVCGVIYAVLQAYNHSIEIGDLVAIISLIIILVDSINNTMVLNFEIYESKIALERMFDFVERNRDILRGAKQQQFFPEEIKSVRLEKVSFSYPGHCSILEEVTSNLTKGKIIGLMGKSGCGKSTLAQMLLKFYQPTSGNILINNNTNLRNINATSWRNNISYIPQQIKVFNTNLTNNISLDNKISKEKVINFCKKYGFNKFFISMQDGYDTILGEEGVNLSGGEKQLLAFARVLFHRPHILILDEATSSVDKSAEEFIIKTLLAYKKNLITLFITHNKQLLTEISDKIYRIIHQKIIVE